MTGLYRIAGVGGQGVITLAKAISNILMDENLDPAMSEIHGLSQRGGSVVSDIKFSGAKSPILTENEAEVLVALNSSEAFANMYILKENGICLGNCRNKKHEDVVEDSMDGKKVYWVDCQSIGGDDSRASANMVLLGFISAMDRNIPFDYAAKYVADSFGTKYQERNLSLLKKGYEAGCAVFADQIN